MNRLNIFNPLRSVYGLFIFVTVASCNNGVFSGKCCDGTLQVSPSNYNKDAIFLYTPNAVTPNDDGLNDCFGVFGVGIEVKSAKIKRGVNTIETRLTPHGSICFSNPSRLKKGIYKYEVEVLTKHLETLLLEGTFCVILPDKRTGIRECGTCIFPSMIDSIEGSIYDPLEQLTNCD